MGQLLDHAGGAAATTLAADITNASLTITLNAATNWPTGGANGPFYITINRGQSNEERVEVQSRSGTTLTVASTGKRGVDGTGAAGHSTGEPVEHTFSGIEIDDLNNAAFGTPATPSPVTPGVAAAAGTSAVSAKSDHTHNIPTAAAATITGTNSEGTAATAARADHGHQVGGTNHIPGAALVNASVTTTQIATDTIVAGNIAASAVTSSELAAAAVVAGKIAAGGVSATAQIADAIVTLAKMASEAATTFSPSWANITLGTGGSQWGVHIKLGRLVIGWTGFLLGTSGGNVTGVLSFTPPTAVADITGNIFSGTNSGGFIACRASQAAVNNWAAIGRISTTPAAGFFTTTGSSTQWDATTPFDWGNNDHIECIFVYIAPT